MTDIMFWNQILNPLYGSGTYRLNQNQIFDENNQIAIGKAYEYYINGTGNYSTSTAGTRQQWGADNADKFINEVKGIIRNYAKGGNTISKISFVTHSMGAKHPDPLDL